MNSQDLLERSAQEREKIFERYELGREAPIDSWEDPEYNVYSMIDRFGFIHDQKIASPEADDKKTLVKKLEVLAQREKKWIKMLSKWDSKSTKEKLQKRIYKGVPDKVRALVWTKILNLSEIMSDKKNENKYHEMLELARLHGTEARQIDSDVNRQFRENIFFRERYNQRQRSLFNVLVAYSMWNSEVSYCQGMSTLAGMLLMYLGEEETFWALNILLTDEKFAMHGLFILGFPKLTRFLAHHDKVLTKFLPKLKRHFDQCNLDSILYSLKWFFVIFVERIPFSLCLRVWDIYLLEGEKVSIAMAYTVLKLHKSKLMKLKDLDSIVHFLQVKLPKDFGYDDDFVIKALEQSSEELRKAKLELPPPPADNELPQKPFGVFVEPTKDEKIGHRKSDFSSIEKEVTENVIKTREQTAAEMEESHLADADLGESNSQLNTVQIHESEDGGSLNLSKRSLADTSVTSTADLSIFSGGDRRPASEQRHHNEMLIDSSLSEDKFHYSSDIDLHNIVIDENEDVTRLGDAVVMEDEGESSPNSMIKSSSTIQIYQKLESSAIIVKSPSTKNSSETPTPTISHPPPSQDAFNSSDIVRIYVPPADDMIPNDKLITNSFQRERGDDEVSQCSNRSSIVHVEYETLPYDISPSHSKEINDKTANKNIYEQGAKTQSQQQQQPQQYYYYPHHSAFQSSSSRRGSMTRKTPSPMIESDLMIECDHMRMRKMSRENLNDQNESNSMSFPINGNGNGSADTSNNHNNSNNNESIVISPLKRLTSFEELAKKSESNSLLYIHEMDNNNYSTSTSTSRSKPRSDYNICYNYTNLNEAENDDCVEFSSLKHQMMIKKSTSHSYNLRRTEHRKHSSSDNSPFDYDKLREKRKDHRYVYDENGRVLEGSGGGVENSIKSYDRFFNSDDEIDEEYERRYNNRKKSSSNKYRSHVSGTEADDDENSSNSPPLNKSITPLNECIPLLSYDAETTVIYQSSAPPAPIPPTTSSNSGSLRHKSRIPMRVGSNRKNSSISSPDSEKSDGGYQTAINRFDKKVSSSPSKAYPSSSPSHFNNSSSRKSSTKSSDNNKIRIKINQNNS